MNNELETRETSLITTETVLMRLPSPRVEWVDVDGEIVAWNADRESLHILDPIAALVFQLCDGAATLHATIDDLVDVFGHERARVDQDVRELAADLMDLGLVERVA